ncbi:MAG: N-acetylglucosamine-6-phosphate deacetylase [Planctomycetota bacterium]|jgi:N-acetylglucosamine-6-phosphate deacetylase
MHSDIPTNLNRDDSGYFDLQVNGYAGIDFNHDSLSSEALIAACRRLQNDGVAGILVTIITDKFDLMKRRLARIAEIHQSNRLVRETIWGIHIEGPFINENPGYVGAHPTAWVRPADTEVIEQLLEAADGLTRLVTLAPERDPHLKVTKLLSQKGICVSAGHCNPNLDQLNAAIDAGISMFTHLGNACPIMLPRHDNIIQRALSLYERLWLCFIADGIHAPYPALNNYLRCAGIERCIVVTDAMAAAGNGPGEYTLGNQTVITDENMVTRSPNHPHLVGSCATMPQMVQYLQKNIGLSADQIKQLTSINPR